MESDMKANPVPDTHSSATPYLIVSDANAALEFYKAVFHATELVRLTSTDGKIAHAEIQFGHVRIMLADEFPDMGYKSPTTIGGSAVSILVYVEDVDAVYNRAVHAGSRATMPVSDQFDGDRRGTVIDPFGHVWLLASRGEDITYEELQTRFEKLMQAGGDA